MRFIYNPFYMTAISFLLGCVFYTLEWSIYFQDYDVRFTIFIVAFVVSMLFFGLITNNFVRPNYSVPSKRVRHFLLAIFLIGTILDGVYAKGIPLISIIFSSSLTYYKDLDHFPFGIYVLIKSIGVYILLIQYVTYIKDKSIVNLLLLLIISLFISFAANRGLILISLLSITFTYLSTLKKINLSKIFRLVVIGVLAVYIFGQIGSMRSDSYKNKEFMAKNNIESSEIILLKGGATNEFIESNFPKQSFWIYSYIASSIGNLQYSLNLEDDRSSFERYLLLNYTPEFILHLTSNSYVKDYNYFVTDLFNAYTILGLPAINSGYFGVLFYCLSLVCIFFVLIILSKLSYYSFVNYALLGVIGTLSIFANYLQNDIVFMVFIINAFIGIISRKHSKYDQCH